MLPPILASWLALGAATQAGGAADLAHLAWTGGHWQVWTLDLASGVSTQVTSSASDKVRASWYPGGTRLLVATLDGRAIDVDLATRVEREFEFEGGRCFDAALSPDGAAIACSRPASDPYDHEIWLTNPDGSALRALTRLPGMQHQPSWSPDGRWIYFASGQGGPTHDLWRVARDGSQLEQLSAGPRYRLDPAPGPHGELAYSHNRTGDFELWVERDGREPERLTEHAGLDGRSAWAPSGEWIAFERVDAGVPALWLLRVDDGSLRQLPATEGGARAPSWRPQALAQPE